MDHGKMEHAGSHSMSMTGHDHHAMMIADFKQAVLCSTRFNHSGDAAIAHDTALAEC